MARSWDRRKGVGPLLKTRGPGRELVGRVTPGDHVEVSREIERIWAWLHRIDTLSRRNKHRVENIDFSDIESQISDLNDIVVNLPGYGLPPSTIYAFPYNWGDTTGSHAASDVPTQIIPDFYAWQQLGYTFQLRITGGGYPYGGPPVDGDGAAGYIFYSNGSPEGGVDLVFFHGGFFDSGWQDISLAVSNPAPGNTTLVGSIRHAGVGVGEGAAGTIYGRWTGTGINPNVVLASEVGDAPTLVVANATLSGSQSFIQADASSASLTVTLPAVASNTGRRYIVKKVDATANTVTVDGASSETIDGATTYVLGSQWESVEIVCNGVEWYVENAYAGTPL